MTSFCTNFSSMMLTLAEAEAPHQSFAAVMLIVLVTAAAVAVIFRKLRLESIPGYLVAGAIVAPASLGLVKNAEAAEQISELATILLMFTIGLHLDLATMQRGMVHIVAAGVISTLAVVGVLWSVFLLLGVPRPAALLLAMAASISSTAVLVRILMNRRELQSQHGRVSLGVSIVQDLLSVVFLAAIPLITTWSTGLRADHETSDLPPWSTSVLKAALAASGVFLMLWLGRLLLPRLLAGVARLANAELILIVSAALALLSAAWTSFIGFSPEMGAFLAGFLLAGTPFRYQLAGQFAPLRDLLLAIFFTGVGLRVVPGELLQNLPAVLIATVAVIVLKTAIIALTGYVLGMTAPSATVTGVYMGNSGEFSLILIAAGSAALTSAHNGSAVAVVILTLIATPLLAGPIHAVADRLRGVPLSRWVRSGVLRDAAAQAAAPAVEEATGVDGGAASDGSSAPDAEGEPHAAPQRQPHSVIIAGFGPVGRALADRLDVSGTRYVVVELNAKTVSRQASLGRTIVFGDISNHEVLEKAGVHHADAIFITVPDDEAVLHAVQAIRDANPRIFIAARTKFLSGKVAALTLGANSVTVEEVATAVAMEREALDAFGRWMAARPA
ncbi:MAG TPA: cation:proton antiporter [Phycisphaerales bacterium]|nr:cation:proton antiporter [Phycisphaerales bacterium]